MDFAHMFQASLWNPAEWAQVFAGSGAQYVVLTSKHHEGFTNWPSSVKWNWNAMNLGPRRDLVGDLATAIRAANLTFGLYHSLYEWFNPLYLSDKASGYSQQAFIDQVIFPELQELVSQYQPDVIWSDGDWETNSTYWRSADFIAWLYNDAPNKDRVVVNDRWGSDVECHHGDFYTCSDRFNPGRLVNHKWDNCLTIDGASWGWSRTSPYSNYLTIDQLLYELASTVACGGNMLLNVGPTHEGQIPLIFQDRLASMGAWLKINGESIYATKPWIKAQNQTDSIWYTQNPSSGTVYAIALYWPGSSAADSLILNAPTPSAQTTVTILGYSDAIKWSASGAGIEIFLPPLQYLPTTLKHAYVFKLTSVN